MAYHLPLPPQTMRSDFSTQQTCWNLRLLDPLLTFTPFAKLGPEESWLLWPLHYGSPQCYRSAGTRNIIQPAAAIEGLASLGMPIPGKLGKQHCTSCRGDIYLVRKCLTRIKDRLVLMSGLETGYQLQMREDLPFLPGGTQRRPWPGPSMRCNGRHIRILKQLSPPHRTLTFSRRL